MANYTCLPNAYLGSFGSGAWNSTNPANVSADDTAYNLASQPNRGIIYGLDQPAAAGTVSAGTLGFKGRYRVGVNQCTCYLYYDTTSLTSLFCDLTGTNTLYTKSYACPAADVGNLIIRHLSASGNPAEVDCYYTYYYLTYTPSGGCLLTWNFLLPLLGAAVTFAQFKQALYLLGKVKGLWYTDEEAVEVYREYKLMTRAKRVFHGTHIELADNDSGRIAA
jgi:hypothetical protein